MAHFRQLNDKERKLDIFLMLLLFIIAVLLRLRWIVSTGFNGLYGQDAYAYFDFAIELRHALTEWRLPEPFFWPLGYPTLLMLIFAVFGASAGVGQGLNVLLGSLLPVLVYILARQSGSRWFGAFIAGLLLAICGQAIQSSIVVMADIPALFWATLSAVLLSFYLRKMPPPLNPLPKALERGLSVILVLSALCLTIAGVTRWLYFVLAPIWTIAVLLHWRGKIRWWNSMCVIAVVLLILLPQLAYSRTTPFPTFNHAWVVGWSPLNALQKSFHNADGQFYYAYRNWRFYAAPVLDAYYVSPVFITFMLTGLWSLWRKSNSDRQLGIPRYAPTILILGWMILPYLFLIGIPYQNIRFPLIIVPATTVLIGIGIDFVGTASMLSANKRILSLILVIVILLIGIGHTLKTSESIIGTFIHNQQQDKAIAAWVNEYLPADATLYSFGLTLTLQHETPFTVYELYYETPESLDAKRGERDYVLLNMWALRNQWEGSNPYIAYYWFRENRGLVRVGRTGNYTLFRVAN